MRLSPARFPALRFLAATVVVVSLVGGSSARPASADENPLNLARNIALMNALPEPLLDPLADPPGSFKNVKPNQFDPAKTYLAQAAWLHGTGCPTGAKTEVFVPPDFSTTEPGPPYTDPACLVGDPNDARNEGLLMFKTGPTNNNVSAVAELINLKGTLVHELGYDIRKQGGSVSALGSHCGAGAPRFNVITTDGFWGVGCNSPLANSETLGNGWTRLRWGTAGVVLGFKDFAVLLPITGTVLRIVIVFDEGQDVAPDFFGGAVLDNIDFNGKLVGRGAVQAN